MMKLQNGRKIFIRKKRKFSLVIAIIVVLICSASYMSYKIYMSKRLANNTINSNKDTTPKPSTNPNMNLRESKVSPEEPSTDSSTINVYKPDGRKIAYLTFDDGPSPKTTPAILKTLDQYNIKATFFLIGSMAIRYPQLVKMEAEDGQSIGNHTYSHIYKYIYSDTNNFINDVNKCDTVLKSILGKNFNSKLLRFPGGSFGHKLAPFRVAIKNVGYHYVDWNDQTGDSDEHNVPIDKLLNNLKNNTKGKEHVVVLMHDAPDKQTTVQELPQVIDYLKAEGYSFNTLK